MASLEQSVGQRLHGRRSRIRRQSGLRENLPILTPRPLPRTRWASYAEGSGAAPWPAQAGAPPADARWARAAGENRLHGLDGRGSILRLQPPSLQALAHRGADDTVPLSGFA